MKFYLDGDQEFPTICGTGTEDYFCGSYGFPTPYSGPYAGTILPANENAEPPSYWSLYRWHMMDPVSFQQRPQGDHPGPRLERTLYKKLNDDIASVAYWYQDEPHAPFPKLPDLTARTAKVLEK